MNLYPSYTKALLLEGARLHKQHLWIIQFNEFGQLPYSGWGRTFGVSRTGEKGQNIFRKRAIHVVETFPQSEQHSTGRTRRRKRNQYKLKKSPPPSGGAWFKVVLSTWRIVPGSAISTLSCFKAENLLYQIDRYPKVHLEAHPGPERLDSFQL